MGTDPQQALYRRPDVPQSSVKQIVMKLCNHTKASYFVKFEIIFPSDLKNIFI
jgi:hypothetical protein